MTKAGKMVPQYEACSGATLMTMLPTRKATMDKRKMRWPDTRVIKWGMISAASAPADQLPTIGPHTVTYRTARGGPSAQRHLEPYASPVRSGY
jgi:hypothetical protein